MYMTSTGCARLAGPWRPLAQPYRLRLIECGLEHPPPARHLGVAAQQRPTLPFGHATPHAELDPVVQGVGEALVAHRAPPADPLRHVLLRALDEQRVWV